MEEPKDDRKADIRKLGDEGGGASPGESGLIAHHFKAFQIYLESFFCLGTGHWKQELWIEVKGLHLLLVPGLGLLSRIVKEECPEKRKNIFTDTLIIDGLIKKEVYYYSMCIVINVCFCIFYKALFRYLSALRDGIEVI